MTRKEKYELLKSQGVTANLIAIRLRKSGRTPQRTKEYKGNTVYSTIHNQHPDRNLDEILDELQNYIEGGLRKNTQSNE